MWQKAQGSECRSSYAKLPHGAVWVPSSGNDFNTDFGVTTDEGTANPAEGKRSRRNLHLPESLERRRLLVGASSTTGPFHNHGGSA